MEKELLVNATKEVGKKVSNQGFSEVAKILVENPTGTGIIVAGGLLTIGMFGFWSYKIIEVSSQSEKNIKVDFKNGTVECTKAA